MKVLFAGPSLYGRHYDAGGLVVRAPARQGDVARAVLQGASAIGLVDGAFEAAAATWHKEILFALESGVRVLGAASMGALRAAECASFGMEPIGAIAEAYLEERLDDDGAVAVLHAPAELGHRPLTEALVNACATIDALASAREISAFEASALRRCASSLFFKDRTVDAIINGVPELGARRRANIAALYELLHVDAKGNDALELIGALRCCEPKPVQRSWQMAQPKTWQRAKKRLFQ